VYGVLEERWGTLKEEQTARMPFRAGDGYIEEGRVQMVEYCMVDQNMKTDQCQKTCLLKLDCRATINNVAKMAQRRLHSRWHQFQNGLPWMTAHDRREVQA
jgi:hypothetical protein